MALYHTYRPQIFSDVLGQEVITTTLSNQIKNGATSHAYLFSGPRGVGKTSTARILAKAISCSNRQEKSAEPCNECFACKAITEGNAIDIIEIDAASNTGVDHVREAIIDSTMMRPTSLPYKIFIIDEVHMLSKNAFNALLKTLEEPPSYVLFILATTEADKLPETVVSRCQHFHFRRISDEILTEHINKISKQEGVKISPTVLDRLIRKSDGCGRDAVRLLDQILGIGKKEITDDDAALLFPFATTDIVIPFLQALFQHDANKGLTIISEAHDQGQSIEAIFERLLEMVRSLMVLHITQKLPTAETAPLTQMKEILKETQYNDLLLLFDIVVKRSKDLQFVPLPSYALELVVYEWLSLNTETSSHSEIPIRIGTKTSSHSEIPIRIGTETSKNLNTETPKHLNTRTVTVEIPTTSMEKNDLAKIDALVEIEIKKEPDPAIIVSEPVATSSANLTEEMVRAIWSDFLSKIEAQSPSLVFILHMTPISLVQGDTITLSASYSFHKDKLTQPKTYQLITQTLATLLQTSYIQMDIIVSESSQPISANAPLQDLTAAFGGEIVQ